MYPIKNQMRSSSIENFRNNKKQRYLSHLKVAERQSFEKEVLENDVSWSSITGYALLFLLSLTVVGILLYASFLMNY
ncbi:MAG: hypothetical protein KBT36_10290 [Kurthia sp.]|nr:hypothetical protein [Candidatus Kurthia equi]